jgi:hypothetical protein
VGVGGFGGLGALGQALTGPDVPTVEPAAAGGRPTAEDAGNLLALAAADQAEVRRQEGPAATRRRRSAARRPASGNRPTATPTPGSTPAPSGGSNPAPSATPNPTPAPTPTPVSTVRNLGNQVKEVTDQVPVAGEPAGQVVDLIVDTAEQLPLP